MNKTLTRLKSSIIVGIIIFMIPFSSLAKKDKSKKDTKEISTQVTKNDLEEQALFIEGMQAYLLGNPQDAIAKFNDVLRRNTKNDVAFYQLSKIAYEAGNMDKSIEFAQNAIKLNPGNEYYYQYLAEAKAEKQDFFGAAKAYETVIKLKPKEYDYYYDWAYMLSKAEKYKEAIDVYNILEQKTGVQEELVFQKQPLFIKLGKIEESIQDIEKLIKLYPTDTRYIGLIGEVYESNKMYDKAIQAYNRILAIDPDNADGLVALSETYRKKGDFKKQDELMKQVFNSDKIDIDSKIVTFIPYIERLSKDSTLADEVMKMADMLNAAHPNDVKATTARADVLYNIGKKKEAQQEYVKAINLKEVPATVWIQLYILDAEIEDYDHLITISTLGIQKNPDDPFGYFYNAIANQQKKNFNEAGDVIEKAFQIQDEKQNYLFMPQLKLQMLILLGDISYELKNYERSDSAYEAALEIDPNNATVLNNYAYYLSERDHNKLEKAEKMSKKSNLLVNNNSAFIDTYAWIMYKMKNYKEALEWMEEAMQLPDAADRPELLSHYGDILFKTGKLEQAIIQWKKAIEKGGDRVELENKINNKKLD